MNIPNFMDIPVITKGAMFTDEWRSILEQLITQLQVNAGQQGFVVSSLTAANIALLTNVQNGTIVYNTDANTFQGYQNGSWKTFTLT